MTTTEAAIRLLRHADVTDIAALSRSQAAELAGAISAAVGLFFQLGPRVLRQTSASVILPAPTTVSSLSINANALEVSSGTPFSLGQRGSTVILSGDANRNEIVSTVGWLSPYRGPSGSGKTARVYGDAVPISNRLIDRILSDPFLLDGDTGTDRPRRLMRVRDEHETPVDRTSDVGTPEYYAMQPTGVARGASTQYLIRVWPLPERQFTLRFECEVSPDMFDETNIAQVPVVLPFSDVQMETIVLPLAEAELLTSTLLLGAADNKDLAGRIESRAARALAVLKTLPNDHGKPRGRIRTKPGY